MCGIVGILGKGPVAEQLVDALKRLEYRGYDSAGVATVENGELGRRRAEGKLRNLEQLIERSPLEGSTGIGSRQTLDVIALDRCNCTSQVALLLNAITDDGDSFIF